MSARRRVGRDRSGSRLVRLDLETIALVDRLRGLTRRATTRAGYLRELVDREAVRRGLVKPAVSVGLPTSAPAPLGQKPTHPGPVASETTAGGGMPLDGGAV